MSFYVSLQVSRIHCSSFLSSTASITLPRSESQPTVLCRPPPNSPSVLLALITSDLTVIGPARLHQGDPSTVAWAWPLRLSPHDLGVRCGTLGAHGMNKWTIWGKEGAGHTNSPLPSIMWALCCAYPETLRLDYLLSFYPARLGGGGGCSSALSPCVLAIWPKRKSPECMNKGTGLLQAELKLVYYGAPFEISEGGSGRAKSWGFSLFAFFCLFPCSLGSICYRRYCDPQAESKSAL